MSQVEVRAKKRLTDLEQEAMGGDAYGPLIYDDLKFQAMAQHKLVQDGQVELYDQIDENKVKKRDMRRLVLSEDITELSDLEENFNERNARIEAGDMKPRRRASYNESSNRSSDAVSSFDSDASRVNFWKDINTKDEEYADGAVFMRGTVDTQNKLIP